MAPFLTDAAFWTGVVTFGGAAVAAAAIWAMVLANRESHQKDKEMQELRLATANAVELAEREKLARTQLEAKLAPRRLVPAQQDSLSSLLKTFGVGRIDIFLMNEKPEVFRISNDIESGIRVANWGVNVWKIESAPFTVAGVVVATRKGDSSANNTANALIEELSKSGIDSSRMDSFDGNGRPANHISGPPWDEKNVAPIRIIIGEKPY